MESEEEQGLIKKTIRKTYGKLALQEDNASSTCCAPGCCSVGGSSIQTAATTAGYETSELESVPQGSVLGAGCGAPVKFADMQKGETAVDLGSGAGIDVFLSANKVGKSGKVIGIDMTNEMIERAKRNAKEGGYNNTKVEFRKGDIEKRIPVDDNSADVVISNCVINLTMNKLDAFKEVYRILKHNGGRMVISDLVTDKEIVAPRVANAEKWSSCIDGTLTKKHYLDSIRKADFTNVEVLSETIYMDDSEQTDGRRITSVVVRAIKK
jgi:arsenite methyltransferase